MRFSGSLADLSITDVLQVLQATHKSGTLIVHGQAGEAVLVLREGLLLACRHPSPALRIGDILLEAGAVSAADVEEALRLQADSGTSRKPLVGMLVEMGRLEREAGWKALERLVELTLAVVNGWSKGSFDFTPGLPESFDAYGDVPEGWVPGPGDAAQGMVSEALRIIEEHGEGEAGGSENGDVRRTHESVAIPEMPPTRALAVLSSDGLLRAELVAMGAALGYSVFASEVRQDLLDKLVVWREAGLAAALVVDLPPGGEDPRWDRGARLLLRLLRADTSEMPVLVLCEAGTEAFADAFALGACAALPRPPRGVSGAGYVAEIRACGAAVLSALAGTWQHQSTLADATGVPVREMSLLREYVHEMRLSSRSGGVSLVALRYVATLVDRCILFLVRQRDMLGVGAFGLEGNEGLAAGLKLPIEPGSLLAGTIESGQLFSGIATGSDLASHLHTRIGAPASPEIVLVPLRAQEHTAAIIYGDFGAQVPRAVDRDALEILAEFAGLAFDLALRERESASAGPAARIVAAS